MLDIDINKLEACWDVLKKSLKDGLLFGDIWHTGTAMSVSSYNSGNAAATALFDELTKDLNDSLSGSGFPALNRFYLLNLKDNRQVLIVRHGDDLVQGMALDPKRVNIGLLFAVAVPKALTMVEQARN